jgi:hypothetical protein
MSDHHEEKNPRRLVLYVQGVGCCRDALRLERENEITRQSNRWVRNFYTSTDPAFLTSLALLFVACPGRIRW